MRNEEFKNESSSYSRGTTLAPQPSGMTYFNDYIDTSGPKSQGVLH